MYLYEINKQTTEAHESIESYKVVKENDRIVYITQFIQSW